jgi:hypothetical protein
MTFTVYQDWQQVRQYRSVHCTKASVEGLITDQAVLSPTII